MLSHPYLANAVARLPFVDASQSVWCNTFATDGYHIYFDRTYADSLSEKELSGVLAHELFHCILGHMDRREHRIEKTWNIATDYVINLLLIESGFVLPKGALFDRKYRGMPAEAVYRQLLKLESESDDRNFDVHLYESGAVNRIPVDVTLPSKIARRRLRRQLISEVRNGLQGRLAGLVTEELTKALSKEVHWSLLLANFTSGIRKSDFQLFPPNRKHLWRGFCLPSLGVPGPNHLVIAIDTSGSMDIDLLSRVLGELDQLRMMTECKLTIIECDAEVQKVSEFESWELTTNLFEHWHMSGRGGTSFDPPFRWIEENLFGISKPDAVFYFTDGFGSAHGPAPSIPVVWLVPEHGAKEFPFGSIITVM